MADVSLDEGEKKVLSQVRTRTAMPFLEIAAETGLRGADLRNIVKQLADKGLVTVQDSDSPVDTIVSALV